MVKRIGQGEKIEEVWQGKEGEFVNDKRNGKGKYTWTDGDVYVSDFVDGKRTGKVKYTYGKGPRQGDKYEGDFVVDRRTGKGNTLWKDGAFYPGHVLHDDDGKLHFPNGTRFIGKFVNGTRISGTIHFADGLIYTGLVNQDGKAHGRGCMLYPDVPTSMITSNQIRSISNSCSKPNGSCTTIFSRTSNRCPSNSTV